MRNGTGAWHWVHLGMPPSSVGGKTISFPQPRHLVSIISDMKPLILLTLVLLVADHAQAQTIADTARKERERQAQVQSTKIFTTEDAKSKDSKAGPDAKPVENSAPTIPPLPGATASTTPAATAEPVVDPLQKWTEEMTKLRARVRELMDQETALQLEINNATAAINAPVTSQSAKNQANKNLEAANTKLLGVRAELAKMREEVNSKELQGPPTKKVDEM
jgi:hypothetical protein